MKRQYRCLLFAGLVVAVGGLGCQEKDRDDGPEEPIGFILHWSEFLADSESWGVVITQSTIAATRFKRAEGAIEDRDGQIWYGMRAITEKKDSSGCTLLYSVLLFPEREREVLNIAIDGIAPVQIDVSKGSYMIRRVDDGEAMPLPSIFPPGEHLLEIVPAD